MGAAGQGSISFSPKQDAAPAPGPPFNPASADNGLSVDAVTGKIVFGNDVGSLGMPGQLLSGREVDLNNQMILFSTGSGLGGSSFGIFEIAPGAMAFAYQSGSLANQSTLLTCQPSGFSYSTTNSSTGNQLEISAVDGTFMDIRSDLGFEVLTNQLIQFTNSNINDIIALAIPGDNSCVMRQVAGENEWEAPKLRTTQPSVNGAGKWRLGKNIVAATVFDNTHYVEVMIDGVIRKLATVV